MKKVLYFSLALSIAGVLAYGQSTSTEVPGYPAKDAMAGILIKHLQAFGGCVPKDISIIGFDCIDYLCEMTSPILGSVLHPVDKAAKMAVALLMAQINGAEVPHKTHYIKPLLKIGGSCGCII